MKNISRKWISLFMIFTIVCISACSHNKENIAELSSDAGTMGDEKSAVSQISNEPQGQDSSEQLKEDRAIHMVMQGNDTVAPSKSEAIMQTKLEMEEEDVSEITLIDESGVRPEKDFTIMVYMIGSTLEYSDDTGYIGAATADIEEMISSNYDYDSCNVIVYTGGTVSWANGLPAYVNCILDLSKYSGDGDLTNSIVAFHEGNPSMGNPRTLASFINYCSDMYPAQRTGLIMWDHGNGPLYGYGNDVLNSNDGLLLPEFRKALEDTKYSKDYKLAFVGFDACLMASIENAYIWQDYADYLVGSEEIEPTAGWNYSFLKSVNSGIKTEDLVKDIVTASTDYYGEYHSDFTLSAMDLRALPEAIEALNVLFDQVNAADDSISLSVIKHRNETKEFGKAKKEGYANSELIDIADFCEQLSDTLPDQAQRLSSAIRKLVISNKTNLDSANGITIYYPNKEMQLYRSVFEEFYKLVNPSESYNLYLSNYAKAWGNITSEYESNDTTGQDYSVSPSDEGIVLYLNEEQQQLFATAEYTIYDVDEENYIPILANVDVKPDEAGKLLIPDDPFLLSFPDDTKGRNYPWRVWQIEHGESRDVYQATQTYLITSRGEFSAIDDTTMPVTLRIVSYPDGSFETQDIVTLSDDPTGTGRQETDLDHYESLLFFGSSYEPSTTENGYYLPLSQWNATGRKWGNILFFDGNFQYSWEKASSFDSDFVVQVTYTDIYGNVGTSGFIPLNKKEEFVGVETDAGMLRFRIHEDHAELISYEGNDYDIQIRDEVEGKPVTVIGCNAFSEIDSLRKIVLPSRLTTIGQWAFDGCTCLKEVSLPSSLLHIYEGAFNRCESLEEVILPESLQKLSDSAFSGCASLKHITIPQNLKDLGSGVFSYCSSLLSIDVDTECTACKLVDNVLLSHDGKTLLAIPQGVGTYIRIPMGVETIGYAAFAGFKDLRKVEFPDSMVNIKNYAFYDCSSLDNLSFPDSLKSIGSFAFGGSFIFADSDYDGSPDRNPGKAIKIGKNITYIGSYAFEGTATEEFIVDERNSVYSSKDGFLMDKTGIIAFEIPTGRIKNGEFTVPDGIIGVRDNLFSGDSEFLIVDFHLPASLSYIPADSIPYHLSEDIKIYAPVGSMAEAYSNVYGVTFVPED